MIQNNPRQKGLVIWLMGLSGAGKSTIATGLEAKLNESGFFTFAVCSDLTFTEADRLENIRRVAEISKMLVQKDVVTICSFITPMLRHRELCREILNDDYFEVFVDCPVSVCEERDVKGLYKKARNNEIPNFTGINAGFERPLNSDLVLNSHKSSSQECVDMVFSAILPYILRK
jgi:adenylylsulfate kinase